MRAWLVACAALALAHAAAPVAVPTAPTAPNAHTTHTVRTAHSHRAPRLDPARLDHIKTQILSKLGLSARPTPLGAPPRDVVRQILARAADPHPPHRSHEDDSMREIIAIAHRGIQDIKVQLEENSSIQHNLKTLFS